MSCDVGEKTEFGIPCELGDFKYDIDDTQPIIIYNFYKSIPLPLRDNISNLHINTYATNIPSILPNLEPHTSSNVSLSYLGKKEEQKRLQGIFEISDIVQEEIPEMRMSHIDVIVTEQQYPYVYRRLIMNNPIIFTSGEFLMFKNSKGLFGLGHAKKETEYLAEASRKDVAKGIEKQGYIFNFTVPPQVFDKASTMFSDLFSQKCPTLKYHFQQEYSPTSVAYFFRRGILKHMVILKTKKEYANEQLVPLL